MWVDTEFRMGFSCEKEFALAGQLRWVPCGFGDLCSFGVAIEFLSRVRIVDTGLIAATLFADNVPDSLNQA